MEIADTILPVILSINKCPESNKNLHNILYTAVDDSSDFSVARTTINCKVLLAFVDNVSDLFTANLHELIK